MAKKVSARSLDGTGRATATTASAEDEAGGTRDKTAGKRAIGSGKVGGPGKPAKPGKAAKLSKPSKSKGAKAGKLSAGVKSDGQDAPAIRTPHGMTTAGAGKRARKDAAGKLSVKLKKAPVPSGAVAADKVVVLTTTDISDHLAKTFAIPKTHAKIYLSEVVVLIGKSLRKGHKVRIAGLGVFETKKRAARQGHNPSTGEAMKIKAGKRVGFAASSDLKASL